MEQPLGDHGQHELPFPPGLGRQEAIEAEVPQHADKGFHRPMRQGVLHYEEAVQGHERHILQQQAECVDLWGRPMRQMRQGALAAVLAFPPCFAQQERRTRVSIGNCLDIHGPMIARIIMENKQKSLFTWEQKEKCLEIFSNRNNSLQALMSIFLGGTSG
jgi:hypothetical protein